MQDDMRANKNTILKSFIRDPSIKIVLHLTMAISRTGKVEKLTRIQTLNGQTLNNRLTNKPLNS